MSGGGSNLAHNALAVVAVGSLLASGGLLADRIQPAVDTAAVGMSAAQQERVDKMASASLFGQFRSSMADFLWLKVDKYLHNGVDLRGLTSDEKEKQNADRVTSARGDQGWKHRGDETTVVPSQQRDWRGVLGNIERQVQPYQDMENHTHRDPKEALPLFRLMTWSNPHFIPGYTTGASMIAREKSKYREAVDFLLEGERQNPDNLEIESALGMMMTAKTKEFDRGLPHLEKALAAGAVRDRKTFTDDEDEAYENAFRWLVLNRREAGDAAAARRAAVTGLKIYPLDVVCRRYLEHNP